VSFPAKAGIRLLEGAEIVAWNRVPAFGLCSVSIGISKALGAVRHDPGRQIFGLERACVGGVEPQMIILISLNVRC